MNSNLIMLLHLNMVEFQLKKILLGIVNILNGLLHFYERGINYCYITEKNILFLSDEPSKMRMLNFGIHENTQNHELKKNVSYKRYL